MPKIAVVGAGLAGLTFAHAMRGHADVVLFEKSRGPGGRMATRTAKPFAFDHGAQYFTVRDPAFREFLQPYLEAGVVRPWDARIVTLTRDGVVADAPTTEPRFIAQPGMTALAKALARDCDVALNTQIASLSRSSDGWHLATADGDAFGPFDWAVCAAPAEQSARLLPDCFNGRSDLQRAKMTACFTLMLGFEPPMRLPFDAAVVKESPISWIALNNSKPGRPTAASLVIHSTNDWAENNVDRDVAAVQAEMIDTVQQLLGQPLDGAIHARLHRWRYADTTMPAGIDYCVDAVNNLAACGDWCIKGRVEAAFQSAHRLSSDLIARIRAQAPSTATQSLSED